MNKYAFNLGVRQQWWPTKLLLIMKLTFVIITTFLLQVSASSFGQRVTLSEKNASLGKMFQKIRQQTGYDFFFDGNLVQSIAPVSIHVSNVSLEDALNSLFAGQPLTYEINAKSVIIRKQERNLLGNLVSHFKFVDVRGTVRDSEGKAMAGASVSVKGGSQIVMTNDAGTFSIQNLNDKDILVVTFVGYVTQEIPVKNNLNLAIVLKEEIAWLGEVSVSTGYQDIKSAKMTGAVVTIGSEELEKRNVTNLLSNLEGKVPGLVYYNGATTIRGIGTMISSQSVLVVVDGFPIEGSVADINPYDVESINILKDAAAAAIYGARASNGVIVVTTKKAKVKGKTTVDFSTNYSYFQKPDYTNNNYMTPAEQVDVESKFADYFFRTNTLQTFEANIESGLSITPVQYAYYQFKKGLITNAQMQSQLDALKGNDFAKEYKDNALSNRQIQQYNFAVRTKLYLSMDFGCYLLMVILGIMSMGRIRRECIGMMRSKNLQKVIKNSFTLTILERMVVVRLIS